MEREYRHEFADENDSAKETKKEKKELTDLHERLQSIIRTVSGNNKLQVVSKVPAELLVSQAMRGKDMRKEWFFMPKVARRSDKEYVYIPKNIIESNENVAKGKAAHEGAHAAVTRFAHFVPDEVMQRFGFHGLFAASEERPTDQAVRDRFAGAGEWLDEARADSEKDGQQFEQFLYRKLGFIPKFQQLAGLVVYAPHHENPEELYDEDVIRTYEGIRPYIEEIEHAIPPEGAKEEEVMEMAKERYRIFYADVWPRVQELVEYDKRAEEVRQMVNQMMQEQQQSQQEGQQQSEGKVEQAMEALPQELKEELQQKLEQAQGGKQQPEPSGEQTEQGQEEGEGEPQQQESQDFGGEPVPVDDFSEELMEAVQEVFNKLPKEVKQEIQKKAQEVLEKLEDEMVKQMAAKLDKNPPETHKQFHEREEREFQEQLRNENKELEDKKAREVLQDIERKEAAVQEQIGVYEEAYKEIQGIDEDLYRRLEEIFTPNIKRTTKLRSSGSKINLPQVFKWEASRGAGAQNLDSKIFETTHLPEKKDYAFSILVDQSGSMRGEKIAEAFKAVVLLSEVLNRLGVKLEVFGFSDEITKYKRADQTLTDSLRNSMANLRQTIRKTNTGRALFDVSKDLEQVHSKNKFILTITDGVPEMDWINAPAETHQAVKHIEGQTDQKLIGLGLGQGTEMVKEFFPNSIPNIKARDLPDVLADLLEDMIRNPEKYGHNA